MKFINESYFSLNGTLTKHSFSLFSKLSKTVINKNKSHHQYTRKREMEIEGIYISENSNKILKG